jgi:hypothetical protein
MLNKGLDGLSTPGEEQKHDPRLMPLLWCALTFFFGLALSHHLRDTSWAFWQPMVLFLMAVIAAIQSTWSELKYVRERKDSCTNDRD